MALQPIQTSFARGEISPRLHGRVDLALYRIGLELCKNFVIFAQGVIARLPGTRFVERGYVDSKAIRGLPFEFSTEQAYFIEAGDFYFRFYRNQGSVFADPTNASVTNGTFDTDLSGWTVSAVIWNSGRAEFQSPAVNSLKQQIAIDAASVGKRHVISFDTDGFASGNLQIKIGSTDGGTDYLNLTIDETEDAFHMRGFVPTTTTIWLEWTGDSEAAGFLDNVVFMNNEVVRVGTPYKAEELFEIQHTQSADTMYFAHKDHAPRKLLRYDNDSWSVVRIVFTDPPSEWAAGNYPQRVGFFEDRLAWAAAPKQPQTVNLSKTGDYEVLTIPSSNPTDEDALKFTISAGQVNAIQWLVEEQQLQIGTTGATRTIAGAGTDVPLTGTSIKQKRHSTYGSASIQPVQIGAVTVYVGRFLKRLREFLYSFENDRYVSPDISILSEHLLKPGVKDFAFAQDPDSIIWMVTLDGRLVGVTYERDQQVNAFHNHDTDGAYESIATIPGSDRTELWTIVRRTVNGQTRRYVEFFESVFDTDLGDQIQDSFFIHSGLTYDGTGQTIALTLSAVTGSDVTVTAASDVFTTASVGNRIVNEDATGIGRITAYTSATEVTMQIEVDFASTSVTAWTNEADIVSGLDHLEAKGVVALADGTPFSGLTVVSGSIKLPDNRTGGIIHVGLNYTSVARTLRLAGLQDDLGTSQGRLKYINEIVLRLRDTLGISYGKAANSMERLVFRKTGQPMDAPPPLFSGDKIVAYDQGWNREGQVEVIQDQPLPCEIQAVIARTTQGSR